MANKCGVCKGTTKRNEKYDAYYCETCNKWAEDGCDDPNCTFCDSRPEKPLP